MRQILLDLSHENTHQSTATKTRYCTSKRQNDLHHTVTSYKCILYACTCTIVPHTLEIFLELNVIL